MSTHTCYLHKALDRERDEAAAVLQSGACAGGFVFRLDKVIRKLGTNAFLHRPQSNL